MPVNTVSVATAVTPTVIETYISHYLNRRPLRQKPTAHISYHEGLALIRRFLHYASFHTVEEIQAFTSQWVPVPHWVYVKEVEIQSAQLTRAAEHIQAQLGPEGTKEVGGKAWWQWRREKSTLKAEWIEMRKDHDERKKAGQLKGQRIMLYVHGGAYYFGSVDEHRYQMQRHARKLRARVLAPRYRLAPQFPFPCGLHDCLAAYLYLLDEGFSPSTIILAGDSAGGGMVVSMLVTLRDQGVPLPAGAVLISPWVDLTHSFPSLGGDGKMDYIPSHGFVHKPSVSWPPPNVDDLLALERGQPAIGDKEKTPRMSLSRTPKEEREAQKEERAQRVHGFSVTESDRPDMDALKAKEVAEDIYVSPDGKYSIGPGSTLSVQLDTTRVEIKDQIQMYASNHLLTHPLVSPALQPTLGGLPPLLIQVGGGELLRDEQIYLAHKAAQPLAYLPPPSNHLTAEAIEAQAARYRPTNVQLQVWDDLCHVAPTLSFTRPAKYMYRSIAQFGAWALARAQKTSIDILDDDSISFVSGGSSVSSATTQADSELAAEDIKLSMPQSAQHVGFESVNKIDKDPRVGKAGDPLPAFENHMIRQRVDRHGHIQPLAPREEFAALNMACIEIGVPKPGPVGKWMEAQKTWNGKFAKEKLKIQKKRVKDLAKGYEGFDGETPPPTALAGRRVKGFKAVKSRKKKSWGMALWSLWGSKHDEMTIVREEKAEHGPDQEASTTTAQPTDGATDNVSTATDTPAPKLPAKSPRRTFSRKRGLSIPKDISRSRSRSRHSTVTDRGQALNSVEDLNHLNHLAPPNPNLAEATKCAPERHASPLPSPRSEAESFAAPAPDIRVEDMSRPQSPETLIPSTDGLSTRPTRGGIAYPFSLRVEGDGREVNASTVTLQSLNVATPLADDTDLEIENEKTPEIEQEPGERPGMERFVTADVGELLSNMPNTEKNVQELERPGVERFETAQEDLNTLANGTAKV
ncbi:alpha/beta-hydrolase [Aaosphaeria arxii CBS 175.79]|uniref:Alpha/beta-hydrolase n=1 Tax=Aaosphaeria arxii CBS 175.79 TaxID=1450172 RepID=A0A6A5X8Y3_9PLEO|nr:alpha/beta-hydrolase [Aaosphaeria arxii CBS 175.79]KAF2009370.1 alpha/beta-hydrolase [Aaosphaeria arxii CBS 175.79]